MRHRSLLISGSLATLGLVIAVGVMLRVTTPAAGAAPGDVLWTLTSLEVNGQTHALVPDAPVTLTFHESDHTITGSAGVNPYQATYQQQNSQVRFHHFAIGGVGCAGSGSACSAKEQEDLYLQALMQAETLLVSGKGMTITGDGGKDILRFSSS